MHAALSGPLSMSGEAAIYFNPWDEAYRANPYVHYALLYGRLPQLSRPFIPIALVARYAGVAAALRDHYHLSSVPPKSRFMQERMQVFGTASRLVFSDPPAHTRLR